MASPINPEISNADLTTCPICLEQMTVPKCLPCLHSFCETCIVAYCEHFTAASDIQQTLECAVTPASDIQQTLECSVISASDIQQTLECPVISASDIQQTLECPVISASDIQQTLECPVISASDIQQTLECPVISASDIQQTLECAVTPASDIQQTLECPVIPASDIQQTLECPVTALSDIQQTLECAVTPASDIQQPLECSITPASDIQQTLECPVISASDIQQTLECPVTASSGIQQTLECPVTASSDIQQTLECPVCRSELNYTKQKGTSETLLVSPEKWVQSLPLNFLIVELLERKKFESPSKMCFSCERLGLKSEAINFCKECGELLCEMCTKYHRANKSSATHNIHLFTELSRNELNSKQCCNLHPGEILKLYCCDHKIECCSLCVSVDHRKCETVQTIEMAAKDICQSDLPKNIKETLVCSKQKLNILRERYIADSKTFEDQVLSIVERLIDFRRDIKTKVDIISDKLTAELTQFSENSDRKYRSMVVELDSRMASIDNELRIFTTVFEKASNVQIMATMKELKKKTPLHTRFTNQITNDYFHPHLISNITKELDNINVSLGKCMVSTINEHCEFPLTCNLLPSVKLQLISEIKTEKQNNEACFSSNGNIFVANFSSKCIDMYSVDSTHLNTVQLDYSPFNLASDGHGYIAVLNRDDGIIEFLNEKTLVVDQRFPVSKNSDGISLNEKFLAVKIDSRVECYDRLKGTLYTKSKFEELPGTTSSWYVHLNEKGFYLPCGDIIYFQTFPDMPEDECDSFIYADHASKYVEAVETDDKGNVYYTDSQNDMICLISCDGLRSQAINVEEELVRPRGLCLSKDQKNLLVTNDMGSKINVYEIEKDGYLGEETDVRDNDDEQSIEEIVNTKAEA
ncbi:unnamed protein product [Mytilus edulis]|uniref:Uncharacterized protein n=1 Tax=Mytilus edulis TaxID=6550 RepID=A0A8S3U6F9_MYTED|nr:unnamed protein product [Mytilus edulis]